MPGTTSDRKLRARMTTARRGSGRTSTESSDTSSEREEEIGATPGPEDLDQSWPHEFKARDKVWVRVQEDGQWYHGSVISSRPFIQQARGDPMGKYWIVNFLKDGKNNSSRVSPLNGEIKPDTEHVRGLLRESGFLD